MCGSHHHPVRGTSGAPPLHPAARPFIHKSPTYPETFEIQMSPYRAQELPKPQELFSQMNNEKIKKRSDGPKSHWLQIGWTTAPPPIVPLISRAQI